MGDRKWQPGDMVRLKTGGWPMTVEFYVDEMYVDGLKVTGDNPYVQCVWFKRTSTGDHMPGHEYIWSGLKREQFAEDALEKSEPLK